MYVSSLSLSNFRNYENAHVEFSPGTNLITGDNAQGKTNILEAVYLFSHGKSHRSKQDGELINFDAQRSRQIIAFSSGDRTFKGDMILDRSGKKQIKINNIAITKLSRLMSYLNVVLFSPEDLSLIKGAPSARRRFMDSAISQLYPSYLSSLAAYQKALVQKNSLLKELRRSGVKKDATLSAWNSCLAEEGKKITEYRIKFLDLLGEFAGEIQREISSEQLELFYEQSIKSDDIFDFLEAHQTREIEYASSLFGIQRDDIKISVNGRDTRIYCSQGQQRTAALSLKIAHGEYIRHVKDEYPVLLLDDIMSELDKKRREYLWQKIKDKQVLLTCTDKESADIGQNSKIFKVENGTIREE